jgi:hypothetical protein
VHDSRESCRFRQVKQKMIITWVQIVPQHAVPIHSQSLTPKIRNRGKFPGGGSQGLENVIQARDDIAHP